VGLRGGRRRARGRGGGRAGCGGTRARAVSPELGTRAAASGERRRLWRVRVRWRRTRRRTVMTGGTNASVKRRMNRRCKITSVGRTVGALMLLGESNHRMDRRPENTTRRSSCARVWEEGRKTSAPDEPMVKRREASVHPTVRKFLTVSN
jgi:hypothetical protein